jgi:hypothetical protein
MPFLPAPLSVTAITIATSPFWPLVMNCLTPLMMYPLTVLHRRGAQARGVRAHMRLSQAERTQHLPCASGVQPLFLLRGVAKLHQNGVNRAVGHADHRAGATVTRGDFFQHQRQASGSPGTGAAQLLGHAYAVGSPTAARPRCASLREVVLLVPAWPRGATVRPGRKSANRVSHHLLVLGQ